METANRKRIYAGILGLLLGGFYFACMIAQMISQLRNSHDWTNGLWIYAPVAPLLVGAIGTIWGSRLLAWMLFITNSIFLLLILLTFRGHLLYVLSISWARPEGINIMAVILLECLAGMYIFEKRENRMKLVAGFLFAMVVLGFGLRRFVANWPASQIQPMHQAGPVQL